MVFLHLAAGIDKEQEEVVNDDGIQERPPGFQLIALPYADDIRAAAVEESMRGTIYHRISAPS
jgi:hypothetical protein